MGLTKKLTSLVTCVAPHRIERPTTIILDSCANRVALCSGRRSGPIGFSVSFRHGCVTPARLPVN